jgi:protein phosphatase
MKWEAHGATDVGRQRTRNEDRYLVSVERALFAVADGMGGHAAGDVASRTAIETVDRLVGGPPEAGQDREQRVGQLMEAARAANLAILDDAAREPERAGMGTTLTVFGVFPEDRSRMIVHVGDSRAYLLRDGRLSQLTTDHTWVQRQVELGKLSPRRARVHPYSSVLTHALGVPDDDRVDAYSGEILAGDLYLLCTDGLTTVLEDDSIESVLHHDGDLASCAQELIDAANQAGGPDNITVVLVRFQDEAGGR